VLAYFVRRTCLHFIHYTRLHRYTQLTVVSVKDISAPADGAVMFSISRCLWVSVCEQSWSLSA